MYKGFLWTKIPILLLDMAKLVAPVYSPDVVSNLFCLSCTVLNLAKFSLAGQCICVSRSHCSPQQLRTSASGMCLPQHPKKINATTEGGKVMGLQ